MDRTTYAADSKYYSNHRFEGDTEKCMSEMRQLIQSYREQFADLPVEDALEGKLEGQIRVTKAEMEEKAPPFNTDQHLVAIREPMAARTEADKVAAKKHILLYVDRCVRQYAGQPNSVINCAFASIVETMYHLEILEFDEAEALLIKTTREVLAPESYSDNDSD
ncbi:hypothetical protein ACPV5O_07095 [Vibrio maritimus]|uniref:hypothetical protein n=1 Tax=Vibrio maritimus TaxID=990268 RepID=UPI00406899F9